MLGPILIGVAVAVVAFVVLVATRPAAYRVERKQEVAAPAHVVFDVLNDLTQFARVYVLFGAPLERPDSKISKIVEGPPAGVGQSFAWQGKDVGKGKLTIEESVPTQKVAMKLEFVE